MCFRDNAQLVLGPLDSRRRPSTLHPNGLDLSVGLYQEADRVRQFVLATIGWLDEPIYMRYRRGERIESRRTRSDGRVSGFSTSSTTTPALLRRQTPCRDASFNGTCSTKTVAFSPTEKWMRNQITEVGLEHVIGQQAEKVVIDIWFREAERVGRGPAALVGEGM